MEFVVMPRAPQPVCHLTTYREVVGEAVMSRVYRLTLTVFGVNKPRWFRNSLLPKSTTASHSETPES
ncbi:hypothetical protein E2C01_064007 [Portunus trituberculatus]|uniref:Uncharacterized protein n=1 Tax=Portunus trituberculatus TaxID=210409 RepID=A0A5B7HIL4_PORTR|nr:hypothetical protein [Portunus trituberculatus]